MNMDEFKKKTDGMASDLAKYAAKLANQLEVPAVGILVALDKTKCAVFLGTEDNLIDRDEVPAMCAGFAKSLAKMGQDVADGTIQAEEVGEHTVLSTELEMPKLSPGTYGKFNPPWLDQGRHAN